MPGLRWCKLLNAIDKRFPEICGPRTVWTTGRITLDPGSHSIIPGRAEALFQLRDADPAVLDRLHAELNDLVAAANRVEPLPVRAQRDLAVDAGADGRAADERRSMRPPSATRRASTCACRAAPATTRSGSRASCPPP